jgi:hypothetical protein
VMCVHAIYLFVRLRRKFCIGTRNGSFLNEQNLDVAGVFRISINTILSFTATSVSLR